MSAHLEAYLKKGMELLARNFLFWIEARDAGMEVGYGDSTSAMMLSQFISRLNGSNRNYSESELLEAVRKRDSFEYPDMSSQNAREAAGYAARMAQVSPNLLGSIWELAKKPEHQVFYQKREEIFALRRELEQLQRLCNADDIPFVKTGGRIQP